MGTAVKGVSSPSDQAVHGRTDARPPVTWETMGFSTAPLVIPNDTTAMPPPKARPQQGNLWQNWSPQGYSSGSYYRQ
eukprot:3692153-Heterocapsa_arctica.AAC.1